MAWGKEWNVGPNKPKTINEAIKQLTDHALTGIDLGSGLDQSAYSLVQCVDDKLIYTPISEAEFYSIPVDLAEERIKNKVPTHDPYTNPNSHIYYECDCGAILDPGTNRFASLNNAAMNAGWKVRFGAEYYIPYCVKCGEGVE